MSEAPFQPEHFRRQDERDDRLFYVMPRLVTHIDDHAIEAVRRLYAELLPRDAMVLDLMSSWKSHLPEEPPRRRTVGLGMNAPELRENDQLDGWLVHDLNRCPQLPFRDAAFDAVVLAVSVQYLTRPVEVFAEVRRVLRPDGPFVITYSNRLFPEKAVSIWSACDMEQRARLIATYLGRAGGWGEVNAQDRSPRPGFPADPLYAVWARKGLKGSLPTRRPGLQPGL